MLLLLYSLVLGVAVDPARLVRLGPRPSANTLLSTQGHLGNEGGGGGQVLWSINMAQQDAHVNRASCSPDHPTRTVDLNVGGGALDRTADCR